jgi:iron complex transport system permease protein
MMRLALPPILLILLVVAMTVAAMVGAAGIPFERIAATFGLARGDPTLIARDALVLVSIRLPRIALAVVIGALLAGAGAVMQGLFRNPLADPALVGVSSGGGLAA